MLLTRSTDPCVTSKRRTKIYVAILRCNIRDPTYLCSAQI